MKPVCDAAAVRQIVDLAADVEVTEPVETYILEIVAGDAHRTRRCCIGASPRASISLVRAGRAMAAADGREQVYPEDVKALLRPVLAHRMMLTPDAVLRGETVDDVLERAVSRIKAPMGLQTVA